MEWSNPKAVASGTTAYIVPVALMIKVCLSKYPRSVQVGTCQALIKWQEKAETPIYCHLCLSLRNYFIGFPKLEQISGNPPSSIHMGCHSQEQQVSDGTGCDRRGRLEWSMSIRSFTLFTALTKPEATWDKCTCIRLQHKVTSCRV